MVEFVMFKRLHLVALAALLGPVPGALAQQTSPEPEFTTTVCGTQVPPPVNLPPPDSPPLLFQVAPCFQAQGGMALVDYNTYLYYMEIKDKVSRPSQNLWVPYTEEIEQVIRDDFKRLWGTKFLDNLSIEKYDYRFSNGVVGKMVVYNMEERQRVKIVDYVGSTKLEVSKIDEKLKEANAQIRLDTFIDPSLVRKVSGIVRDMLRDKGFQFAEVTPDVQ